MISTLVYRDNKLTADNPPIETLATLRNDPAVLLWVDLAEPTEEEIRLVLTDLFSVHPLTIEDCLQDSPAPKFEEYENYLYIVAHAVAYSRANKFTSTEIDIILGKNFLITFHRQPLKAVLAARERFTKNSTTLVRGPDRFAHTLLDSLVENYTPAVDALRTEAEAIEEAVVDRARAPMTQRIVELREDLSAFRQIIRPQRTMIDQLAMGRTGFFRPKMLPYLRDLSDDLARIEGRIDSWSEQLIFAFKLFLNRASHEANEGIRVLTGLTAITIPLLLLGSWFSMNFQHMPLLQSRSAYWTVTVITVVATGVMFIFLKRRRWF